jgi:hypothetical protein
MTVTLSWHTLGPAPKDDTVFMHLVDPNGRTVAQHDGPPDMGNYATSRWAAGTAFSDVHPLPLPAQLPAGRYTLQIGLYDPVTNERLPLHAAFGPDPPDRSYRLDEVTVP